MMRSFRDNLVYFIIFFKFILWLNIQSILIIFIFLPGIIYFRNKEQKSFLIFGCNLAVRINSLLGIKSEIRGIENIYKKDDCLLIAPHQSILDSAVTFKMCNVLWRTMLVIKKELRKIPILGYLLSLTDCLVFIDRKDRKGTVEMYRNVLKKYKNEKIHLAVFIEGTRNSKRKLLPFKRAPFELAIENKLPIQMIAVSQYEWYRANKPNSTINSIVKILPPIGIDNYNMDNIDKLIQYCRDTLQAECDKLNKEVDERDNL